MRKQNKAWKTKDKLKHKKKKQQQVLGKQRISFRVQAVTDKLMKDTIYKSLGGVPKKINMTAEQLYQSIMEGVEVKPRPIISDKVVFVANPSNENSIAHNMYFGLPVAKCDVLDLNGA